MISGVQASIGGAVTIAAASTLGDFIWATWIPRHLPLYGLTHGTVLFLSIGLFLGALHNRPAVGALSGAVIGGLAAASFYLLAPVAGYSVMFLVWIGVWVALGGLNERLMRRKVEIRVALMRGHGCVVAGASIRAAVMASIYLQVNAQLLSDSLRLGEVNYLSPGEVDLMAQTQVQPLSGNRAWEYWARRAGC